MLRKSFWLMALLVFVWATWLRTPRVPDGSTSVVMVVPQDRAKSEGRAREWLDWNRRTLAGAYDKVGERDPRWDAKAREALEKAARMFSLQVDPIVQPAEILAPAGAAVDAGCDDPLIRYLIRRVADLPRDAKPAEYAARMEEAADAMAASKYAGLRRAVAHSVAADGLMWAAKEEESLKERAKSHYDAALALLPDAAAHDDRSWAWEGQWYVMLNGLIAAYRALGMEAAPAYERVDAALAEVPSLEALRLKVRGNFWYSYGWEARTKAFAPNVPKGGFETLEERAARAREALEASWKLQPDAEVANLLIDIDKSTGGDREAMETWFERAMEVNPDHRAACWSKLDWLDPKWHGSWDELIAFGRACGATGNWRTGITLLAGDAHYRRAALMAPAAMTAYLSQAAVWADVGPIYEEYLKHYPKDARARSKYAMLLYWAGRHDESHAQFQTLGDALTSWTEFPHTPLPRLQAMRAEVAKGRAGR
ncbi:hypothetical protein [Paludisphaera soli]|uniref:hypothetical protein n=1 Tax=Paludisphaera soli TaxID=2712865 RepID=UPI0013EBB5C1|nr:hypothetical protein [Paludisphaera soli]